MKIIHRRLLSLFVVVVILSLALPLSHVINAASLHPSTLLEIAPFPTISGFYSYFPLVDKSFPGYFVATNGSDSNPGTFSNPWRTIEKAAEMLVAGDTVYIRGGVYQEAVEFNNSGTNSAPIKILAYPGEIPVIDGNNFAIPREYGGTLLELNGSYIIVSGLEVRYSSYLGVRLAGAHDIASKINAHHNSHGGMLASGDYTIIEYSQVWSNDMQNVNGINPAGDSTALTAARMPNNAILRHNIVHDNWGIGLSTYESNGTTLEDNIVYDSFGPNVYLSDATNVLFQRNFVYRTGAMISNDQNGILVGDETSNPASANITIINNIVYNTNRLLYCVKGSSVRMVNVLIANNTFFNSAREGGILFIDGISYQNVRFMNNLIEQDGTLPIVVVERNHPGLTFSNNLWSKTPSDSASGVGDVIGDPLLEKVGQPYNTYWFRLLTDSPAIGKAMSLPEVSLDYFENTRGGAPDLGACEKIP